MENDIVKKLNEIANEQRNKIKESKNIVSIHDRLPEDEEQVIVWSEYTLKKCYGSYDKHNKKWNVEDASILDGPLAVKAIEEKEITHWLPIKNREYNGKTYNEYSDSNM